jgi:Flp pilus assembly protein TadG
MKIIKNKRGVSAVEFALLSIPLFTLIMGSIEMGLNMYAKARLENVLRQASRMAVTGDTNLVADSGKKIDDYVRGNAAMVQNAEVVITKESYDKFQQVGQPEKKDTSSTEAPYCFEDINGNRKWDAKPGKTGLGGADDIINYKVTVTYPPLFPIVTNTITGKQTVSITSQATLRNEPFGGATDEVIKNCCVSAAEGNPVTCT